MLYLALEDDYRCLQERLYRMFGTDGADNLFFSVSAGNLGNGLDGQLQEFMKKHNDTRLIIIDTLQKVREDGGDNYSYANDYEIITKLKQFADSYGICILLVHHTRKQGDYYLQELALPSEKEKSIGICGQRHLQYLKEYKQFVYLNLLTKRQI